MIYRKVIIMDLIFRCLSMSNCPRFLRRRKWRVRIISRFKNYSYSWSKSSKIVWRGKKRISRFKEICSKKYRNCSRKFRD